MYTCHHVLIYIRETVGVFLFQRKLILNMHVDLIHLTGVIRDLAKVPVHPFVNVRPCVRPSAIFFEVVTPQKPLKGFY